MARRGPEEEQGHLHGGRNHRKKRAAVCTGDVQTSAADVQTSAADCRQFRSCTRNYRLSAEIPARLIPLLSLGS